MKTYAHPGGFTICYDPETGFLGIPRERPSHKQTNAEYIMPHKRETTASLGGNILRNGTAYNWVELLRWISDAPDDCVLYYRDTQDGLKASNLSWLSKSDWRFLTNKNDRVTKLKGEIPRYRVVVDAVYIGVFGTLEEAQQIAQEAVQDRLECIHDFPFTY